MTKARLDGLYLLSLGALVFILLGVVMENGAASPLADFRGLYFPAQCLFQHCDPYAQSDVLPIYRASGVDRTSDSEKVRQIATQSVYLPTVFGATLPFAMLPWFTSHIAWLVLTIAGLIFAGFLAWILAADYRPVLAGLLVGFLLANSEVLLITGNAAGIVVSLCIVAVWCFVKDRFVLAGVLCLAVSLAVKPHDTGLVWLYLLLAGGIYRRRALQTLLATAVISIPGVLWAWLRSPNWMHELSANLAAFSVRGGTNDPGLSSGGAHGLGTVVSLQPIFSFFRDDPHFYNPASYMVFGLLLLVWVFVTIRVRPTAVNFWLALAAVSALSMLPVYHRQYDTKLLLLAVPACALLFLERGLTGWLALLVTSAGFVLNGDLPWVIFFALIKALHLGSAGLSGQVLIVIQVFAAPLILLAMSVFYLGVYARRAMAGEAPNTE
jgi:hypothetical protein